MPDLVLFTGPSLSVPTKDHVTVRLRQPHCTHPLTPAVDVDVGIKGINVILDPLQLHLLAELVDGISEASALAQAQSAAENEDYGMGTAQPLGSVYTSGMHADDDGEMPVARAIDSASLTSSVLMAMQTPAENEEMDSGASYLLFCPFLGYFSPFLCRFLCHFLFSDMSLQKCSCQWRLMMRPRRRHPSRSRRPQRPRATPPRSWGRRLPPSLRPPSTTHSAFEVRSSLFIVFDANFVSLFVLFRHFFQWPFGKFASQSCAQTTPSLATAFPAAALPPPLFS